jgi:hypothetical protein
MRTPFVRFHALSLIILAVCCAAVCATWLGSPVLRAAKARQEATKSPLTLLGTLSEWKYPGSTMLDGAAMSDGGNPSVVDVNCRAVLTTPDPIEKVVKFYEDKMVPPPAGVGPNAVPEAKAEESKAVSTQDDSEARPVKIRVIVVNKADTTTTLVISRGENEKATHIAWTNYRWFRD